MIWGTILSAQNMGDLELNFVSETLNTDDISGISTTKSHSMDIQQSEIQMSPIFIEFDRPEDVLDEFEMYDLQVRSESSNPLPTSSDKCENDR